MKLASSICAVIAAASVFTTIAARAAPPTVTPSPGYDARLQEQRNAQHAADVQPDRMHKPATPAPHRRKRPR